MEADDAPLVTTVASARQQARFIRVARTPFIVACALVVVLIIVLSALAGVFATRSSTSPPPPPSRSSYLPRCSDASFNALRALGPAVFPANRARLQAQWNASISQGFLLMAGNLDLVTGDGDTSLLFRQNSDFFYVSGVEVPGAVVVFDLPSFNSTLYVSYLDPVWVGETPSLQQWAQQYGFNQAYWTSQLTTHLSSRLELPAFTTPTSLRILQPQLSILSNFSAMDISQLPNALTRARQIKSSAEVSLLQAIAVAASDAHKALMQSVRPEDSEFSAEAFFLSQVGSCMLRRQGYVPIVASGYNSAVLHYTSNQVSPLNASNLLLVDAGGEYLGYDTDVTRTYPIGPTFTLRQRQVYQCVLDAQQAAIQVCSVGVSFMTMTLATTNTLAQCLYNMQLITAPNASLVPLFCPHGYRHAVGLDVHDVPTTLASIQEGYVFAYEPGLYFNKALLGTNAVYEKNPQLVRSAIQPYLDDGFGGIRIEDTFAVIDGKCIQLSTAPKTIEEVEKARQMAYNQ